MCPIAKQSNRNPDSELPDSPLQLTKRLLLFYGASLVPNLRAHSKVTHVVVHSGDTTRLPAIRAGVRRYVVVFLLFRFLSHAALYFGVVVLTQNVGV